MNDAKQLFKEVLERLPDDCSLEELHYHLYVAETINRRRALSAGQPPVQQKDAVARMEKWLIK